MLVIQRFLNFPFGFAPSDLLITQLPMYASIDVDEVAGILVHNLSQGMQAL